MGRMAAGFLAGTHRVEIEGIREEAEESEDFDELGWLEWFPWRVASFALACFTFLVIAFMLAPKVYVRPILIGTIVLAPVVLTVLTLVGPKGWRKEGQRLHGKPDKEEKSD